MLVCALPLAAAATQTDQIQISLPDGCLPDDVAAAQDIEGRLRGAELSARDGNMYRQIDLHIPAEVSGVMADGGTIRQLRFSDVAGRPDRWQRRRGHLVDAVSGGWVAKDLVERGLAIAAPDRARPGCFPSLLKVESTARARKQGLWASEKVHSAHRPDALLARVGHYTLVAGRVLSVGETRSTLYLNFGYRWSRDFTATIAKEELDAFIAAGVDAGSLEGAAIRVRGMLRQSGGPLVEISHPAQIERLETDGARR